MARHRGNHGVHQLNSFAKSAIFVGCPLGNFLSVVIIPHDSRTGTCSLFRKYCP